MTDDKQITNKLMLALNKVHEPIADGNKIVNAYLIYRAVNYIEKMEEALQLIQESPAGSIVLNELRKAGKIKC